MISQMIGQMIGLTIGYTVRSVKRLVIWLTNWLVNWLIIWLRHSLNRLCCCCCCSHGSQNSIYISMVVAWLDNMEYCRHRPACVRCNSSCYESSQLQHRQFFNNNSAFYNVLKFKLLFTTNEQAMLYHDYLCMRVAIFYFVETVHCISKLAVLHRQSWKHIRNLVHQACLNSLSSFHNP
jgi:hypothetical protein